MRKNVERLLRISLQNYRSLFESAHDAIILFIPETEEVINVNQRACEIYGFDYEEFIGKSLLDISRYPERNRQHVKITLEKGFCHRFETVQRRKDGTEIHLEINASAVTYEGRTVILSINRDITERIHTEKKLRIADRRKDEFISLLAHELRNPLAPVQFATEIIKRSETKQDDIRQANQIIERQVGHMTRLIDDLLEVSRITHGKIKLCKKQIDLRTIVTDVEENFIVPLKTKHQTLTVSLPSAPINIEVDPIRIAQVLTNLLDNAIKFSSDDGRIDLVVKEEESAAILLVRDNGRGIPQDKLSSIFQLFEQVDATLERDVGGLGVGLALAQRLVQLHGGTIQAFSDGLNQGSEFVVSIPKKTANILPSDDTQRPAHSGKQASPSRQCVLVVDDNSDTANTLGTLLKSEGYEVKIATSGRSALEISETWRPDVILLDIGMPDLNGYLVAEKLRGMPHLKQCLIIAMTGWGQERDLQRSQNTGFDVHLTKPIDFEHLLKTMGDKAYDFKDNDRDNDNDEY